MVSNWSYPQPRSGIAGYWDKFVGPGATGAEHLLSLMPATLAALAISYYAYSSQLGWNLIQYIVAALLAFDITGGVTTNATSSAKRWYHLEGYGNKLGGINDGHQPVGVGLSGQRPAPT